jgi:hypothetical protein
MGRPGRHERDLINGVLDIGHLPMLLMIGEPDSVQVSRCLNGDSPDIPAAPLRSEDCGTRPHIAVR